MRFHCHSRGRRTNGKTRLWKKKKIKTGGGWWLGWEWDHFRPTGLAAAPSRSKIPPTARRGAHAHTQAPIFLFLCVIGHHLCVLYSSFSSSSSSLHFLTIFFFSFHSPGREKTERATIVTQKVKIDSNIFGLFWLISCLGHFEQKCVRSSWFIRRPCVVHPTEIRRTAGSDALGIVFFLDFFETRPKILKLLFILANCWNPKVFFFSE